MHKYLFQPAQYPVDTQYPESTCVIFGFSILGPTRQYLAKYWQITLWFSPGALKLYFEASGVQNTNSVIFNHQVKTGWSLSSGLCPHAQADLPTPIAQNACGQPQNEGDNECKCYIMYVIPW